MGEHTPGPLLIDYIAVETDTPETRVTRALRKVEHRVLRPQHMHRMRMLRQEVIKLRQAWEAYLETGEETAC